MLPLIAAATAAADMTGVGPILRTFDSSSCVAETIASNPLAIVWSSSSPFAARTVTKLPAGVLTVILE
jgi:ABC-type taurine transport system substrate-binding protein